MKKRRQEAGKSHKEPSRSWKATAGHQQTASLLGENIRRLRTELGLTLELAAERVDLEVSQLAKLERGLLNPTLATLTRIAAGFEKPLEALFKTAPETPALADPSPSNTQTLDAKKREDSEQK